MANQSFSNNPNPSRPQKGGQPLPSKPNANQPSGKPMTPEEAAEDQLKKLLAQMADKDPANIAEIIHLWLNEDKK